MAAAPAPETTTLDLVDLLANDLQAVEHGGTGNDRGAVLVIVEDRNVHPRLELLLDVEALRRLDIFEVDTAERRLEGGNHVDQLVRVVLGQFDVEDVNTGEFLEQATLAFHDRLGSQRADIAEAKHGGAVGHDTDQIGPRGIPGGRRRIFDDRIAGGSNTRRVGQREVALIGQALGRAD